MPTATNIRWPTRPAGLGNSERLMTIDTACTRWADSYDADPNASELHHKRQYLGSQAR